MRQAATETMACTNNDIETKEWAQVLRVYYRMLGLKHKPADKLLSITYALVISILLLALDACNFAGIGDVVARHNEKTVQRFNSLFYSNKNRDRLAALLYTDAAAALNHGGWPMRMMDFADFLDDLATPLSDAQNDEASIGIFANVEIRSADHDPSGFCELIATINKLTGIYSQLPVLGENCLASLSDNTADNGRSAWLGWWKNRVKNKFDSNYSLRPLASGASSEYFAWATLAEMQRIREQGATPILMGAPLEYLNAQRDFIQACYPERWDESDCISLQSTFLNKVKNWPGIALLDLVAILVPLDIGADQGRSIHLAVDANLHASPPWLIAQYLDQERLEKALKRGDLTAPPLENLYTVWGRSSLEDQQRIYDTNCSKQSPSEQSILQSFRNWRVNLRREVIDTLFPPDSAADLIHNCPYHAALDIADIDTHRLTYANFKAFTKNRFVFFGLSMQRFSDTIDTPLYGELPSIFHQLMATDNLLTLGDRYYSAGKPGESSEPDAAIGRTSVIRFLVVGILIYLLAEHHARITAFFDRKAFLFSQLFLCVIVPASLWLLWAWVSQRGPEITWFGRLVSSLFVIFIATIVCAWYSFGLNKQFYCMNTLRNDNLPWLKRHYSGLVFLAPHLVVLAVLYLLAGALASVVSFCLRAPPPNTLAIFVSFVPVYLLFHGGDLVKGMQRLSGSSRVANKVF